MVWTRRVTSYNVVTFGQYNVINYVKSDSGIVRTTGVFYGP